MPRLNVPDIPVLPTISGDPRIGHLLGSKLGADDQPAAVLIGFPSDLGVRRNGGRPGAADGPPALRGTLYRLAPDPRYGGFLDLVCRTRDLGDLDMTGDLEADQQALGQVLAPYLGRGAFVVVFGGGHETSFGHFLGYARAGMVVEILNWDAHTDVREMKDGKGHSGSPFRQALEESSGACRRYVAAGLEPHVVARAHLEYVEQRGRAIWRDEVSLNSMNSIYDSMVAPALVSFDLDAVNQAAAPGVSAPNAGGLSTELWLRAAYQAGQCSAVTSADVVELNPRVDNNGSTARLAALTVWWLLRGCAERA